MVGTLLWLTALLAIGGMYLAVSAKAARSGREVLSLEGRKETLVLENAVLSAQLASMMTPQHMIQMAQSLGFRPARPDEIDYLIVPGYVAPEPFQAPPPLYSSVPQGTVLSPAYTETLGEWLIGLFRRGDGG
jgi:hypothetical protein